MLEGTPLNETIGFAERVKQLQTMLERVGSIQSNDEAKIREALVKANKELGVAIGIVAGYVR
jgi:hypothetical protein